MTGAAMSKKKTPKDGGQLVMGVMLGKHNALRTRILQGWFHRYVKNRNLLRPAARRLPSIRELSTRKILLAFRHAREFDKLLYVGDTGTDELDYQFASIFQLIWGERIFTLNVGKGTNGEIGRG